VRAAGSRPLTALLPDPFIYRPASYFETLQPEAVFGRSALLEVELGSGDGSFLVEWAKRHEERNFLGIERLLGRLRKLDRKAQRAGLANVRGLRIEAAYSVEFLLPPRSVSALHIYFPDPWPKRKHRARRLVNDRFTTLAHRVLDTAGVVYLRTDDVDYMSQITEVFGRSANFQPVETPAELVEVPTDFERDFRARGVVIRRAAFRRVLSIEH
jgi:tRNA (guanine-N7-)-methyltransferase